MALSEPSGPSASRRDFVKSSSLVATGTLFSVLNSHQGVHAAGDDILKVGLIGCGGRGTGAATQALMADSRVKLTAMADVFEDRLQQSLKSLSKTEAIASKIDVPPERQFVGFDAYKQLLASGVDVVLLTSPPHFRPMHLQAAVAGGKHVFAVHRIQDGAIGEVRTLLANDYRGPIWVKPRQPEWTDMHWQMQNWYYFTWLSGDFNVEQHVHNLDLCAWVMGDQYPIKAIGMGEDLSPSRYEWGDIATPEAAVPGVTRYF